MSGMSSICLNVYSGVLYAVSSLRLLLRNLLTREQHVAELETAARTKLSNYK